MEQTATAMFHTQSKDRFTRNSNKTEKSVVKCAYCDKNHYSNECKEFGNLDPRMKQVKRNKLCFNCLGKHQVAICLSKKMCRFCDRKHHSSLCSKNPLFKSDKETIIMYGNHERSDILLKTAVAEVESEGYCSYANILFDEGAQKSFITQIKGLTVLRVAWSIQG